jgi:hypothetical protein
MSAKVKDGILASICNQLLAIICENLPLPRPTHRSGLTAVKERDDLENLDSRSARNTTSSQDLFKVNGKFDENIQLELHPPNKKVAISYKMHTIPKKIDQQCEAGQKK